MKSTDDQHHVLVGTYRFWDGTVRTAADEYTSHDDAALALAWLVADEQFVPYTEHTAEILTLAEYDARHGRVPATQQHIRRGLDSPFGGAR